MTTKAINYIEYDKKSDTYSLRVTGKHKKYNQNQRILLAGYGEALYEYLKKSEPHSRLIETIDEALLISGGLK